jgi:hypothetical protein
MRILYTISLLTVARDSVVGIATRYGLDGPGIEPQWGEIFPTRPDRPYTMGTGSLSRG